MMISAQYPTISIIVEMTLQNPTTSLLGDHSGKKWASGDQIIPSRQHLENESQQLN